MTDQEKHFARFYSGGQVLIFSRDNADLGIARDAEYRVIGIGRDGRGRQVVQLVDEHGRTIRWDPRVGKASQVNVFREEQRDLAKGDRIQWRLVNKDLDLKNAERGTVEGLAGSRATIRWDRDGRLQSVDLGEHKTWDHGYAETVYSAQSKTYARAYVLAPVNSALVNGQNYYTAITRARFGVKLWTEDRDRLADKLERFSGEKTSALEGLGRLDRDSHKERQARHGERWDRLRDQQRTDREERKERMDAEREARNRPAPTGLAHLLAGRAQSAAGAVDRWLTDILTRSIEEGQKHTPEPARPDSTPAQQHDGGAGHDH